MPSPIDVVKIFRSKTGLGLAETKNAVINRGYIKEVSHADDIIPFYIVTLKGLWFMFLEKKKNENNRK